MEVRANIPDEIVNEVKNYTGEKDFAALLISVLKEWLSFRKIEELNSRIEAEPFEFSLDFSSEVIRSLNRSR